VEEPARPSRRFGKRQRSRLIDDVFGWAEDVVYAGIGLLLVVIALVLLGRAAGELLRIREVGAQETAVTILDLLLLVFIVIELLFAVRTTVLKRELIAEPFLLVGIIASIKEIVVLSVKAAEDVGKGRTFDDQLKEIAVLGVLVLLLGATALLMRRKEREPDESEGDGA
jgi:uncharacterized membrane protein (DUF373 family)